MIKRKFRILGRSGGASNDKAVDAKPLWTRYAWRDLDLAATMFPSASSPGTLDFVFREPFTIRADCQRHIKPPEYVRHDSTSPSQTWRCRTCLLAATNLNEATTQDLPFASTLRISVSSFRHPPTLAVHTTNTSFPTDYSLRVLTFTRLSRMLPISLTHRPVRRSQSLSGMLTSTVSELTPSQSFGFDTFHPLSI